MPGASLPVVNGLPSTHCNRYRIANGLSPPAAKPHTAALQTANGRLLAVVMPGSAGLRIGLLDAKQPPTMKTG